MELSSYPKVYAIGHRAIGDIFKDTVLVEEKIDGSQFSFGKDRDGNFSMRSRNSMKLLISYSNQLLKPPCL